MAFSNPKIPHEIDLVLALNAIRSNMRKNNANSNNSNQKISKSGSARPDTLTNNNANNLVSNESCRKCVNILLRTTVGLNSLFTQIDCWKPTHTTSTHKTQILQQHHRNIDIYSPTAPIYTDDNGCIYENKLVPAVGHGRYTLHHSIATGTFSQIFTATDQLQPAPQPQSLTSEVSPTPIQCHSDKVTVVVKIMKLGLNQLGEREAVLLRHLASCCGAGVNPCERIYGIL
jgi:hypothetical protein